MIKLLAKRENEGYNIVVPVKININTIDVKNYKGRENIDTWYNVWREQQKKV